LQWFTWNLNNKKLFLTILTAATRPINVKFSENFVINNRMILFVSKNVRVYNHLQFVTTFLLFIDMQESLLGRCTFPQYEVKQIIFCSTHH
jgi:hypothetical protein